MKLTPLEIRQMTFGKSFRGYNCTEVDDFVETLSDDLDDLVKEIASYKEQLEKQDNTISELEKAEGAMTDTLLMAQKAMENVKANAQKEGELIIRQAEIRAEEITGAAIKHETQLKGEIINLKHRKVELIEKIKSLLRGVARELQWAAEDKSKTFSEASKEAEIEQE
ncbi:MAG: DivIVA domain-containing protein [Nitrospiria bacterium]